MKKTIKYLIIDENNKIIDKFHGKATAMQMIDKLRIIHVGATLKIIWAEDYEELKKTFQKPLKSKRKLSEDRCEFYAERWEE